MKGLNNMRSALSPNNPHYPDVLFYIPSLNRFMDHQWIIVHDIYSLFSMWQINEWLQYRRDGWLTTKSGTGMMLYYLNEEEDDDMMAFFSSNESFGVKVDRMRY
jgi:hypothetical protein